MSAAAQPIVVKLGGSVVTRKRERAKLRPKLLARLATEIADSKATPLVLLHGAGSFGHPGAAAGGLAASPAANATSAQRARSAVVVSAEVRQLHVAVIQALTRAGVSAWSIPVGPLATNRDGMLEHLDASPFRDSCAMGLAPVSFGDVVRDSAWGFSILSADTIAVRLATDLGARKVLFVSDVDGVLESVPGSKGRPRAILRPDRAVLARLRPTPGAPDVTGGIRGKLAALLELADAGIDAGIISGLRDGTLARALRGEEVYGSWAGPSFR